MDLKERIQELCRRDRVAMNKVEEDLGFGKGYLSKLGKSIPNASKIRQLAGYFNVSVDYLINGEESETGLPYYINDDAREMAQFMFENPDYKVLFDASRKIKKEDIETVKIIMDRFRSDDMLK